MICIQVALIALTMFASCGASKNNREDASEATPTSASIPSFNADSALRYAKIQTDFGPRVPNTEAHRKASEWLASRLGVLTDTVILQPMRLRAFDNTLLNAVNIMGRINPDKPDRILLLAHYDCRPWADNDPDPSNHTKPVDGANDGASGVAVLLELSRILKENPLPQNAPGIDILLVDAEDWGHHDDEESWALGTKYFVNNPPIEGYRPQAVILLDMVGAKNATFFKEYFSEMAAPSLNNAIWNAAAAAGFSQLFPKSVGSAVTDDHKPFIDAGIPAIDIIDFRPEQDGGFDPNWHTVNDTFENLDKETLKAVGQTMVQYLYSSQR
ncbi:MAG: M28 family peptidase [Muribaculum sp.]|nr:M28 family peptidase [Muribaculum sp.]